MFVTSTIPQKNKLCVLITHLWVVIHALGWPSPVHRLLWFHTTLCSNCHTLQWHIVHLLWCNTQLFAATRTQCIHHQKDQVAAGYLLNTEWPEVNNYGSHRPESSPLDEDYCHLGCDTDGESIFWGEMLLHIQSSIFLCNNGLHTNIHTKQHDIKF